MTQTTTVELTTAKHADIPKIGQRKRVRVNGRDETLYVNEVTATVRGYWDDGGIYRRDFKVQYTLVPFGDL